VFSHDPACAAAFEAEPEVHRLLDALVRALRPSFVIETGSFHGGTAKTLGRALAEHGGRLDTFDTDERACELTEEAVIGLPVHVHHCPSTRFTPTHPVGLAFLDSDISGQRRRELDWIKPFLGPGAVVAVHDAASLLGEDPPGWECVRLATPHTLALLQVSR
jgi:predicted O-methyltransferase YrrM